MSISEREQRALDSIENELASSGPKLASMLAMFSRLTAGEEMPVRERGRCAVGVPPADSLGTGAGAAAGRADTDRIRRCLIGRLVWRWLWLMAALVLLALALTLGRGTGRSPCTAWRTTACGQAPARPPASAQPGVAERADRDQTRTQSVPLIRGARNLPATGFATRKVPETMGRLLEQIVPDRLPGHPR